MISVILPTVRPNTLGATVSAIRRQTYDDWELVIVAQGQDQQLRTVTQELTQSDSRVRVIWLERGNLSAARNAGVEASRGDVLAFTDDDCEPEAGWLAEIARIFQMQPEIGYLGGEVVAPPAKPRWSISTCPSAQVSDVTYQPSKSDYRAPNGFYMIGANFAMRRSVFERVGQFDPCMGAGTDYGSCEDVDYTLRAEHLDVGFMTTKRLVVHHTYGRRYGLRAFLKHHRNYARGRGALLIKLNWMKHRLAGEWGGPRRVTDLAKSLVHNPARFLLNDVYGRFHVTQAQKSFATEYELGSDGLCVPRAKPAG